MQLSAFPLSRGGKTTSNFFPMPGKSCPHVKVINDRGVHRNLKPVQRVQPRSHLSPRDRGRAVRLSCVPVARGSLRLCRDASTQAGLRHEAEARAMPRSLADGESEATVIRGKPSSAGWPPCPETTACGTPGSARGGGTHLILLPGGFAGGFSAEDRWLVCGGRLCLLPNAPLSALSPSGDL